MRELKFRYWDRDMEIMVGHHSNSMLTLSSFFEQVGSCVGYTPDVMQYTGRKDKNSKEIYEGDILEIQGEKYAVYYNERLARFELRNNPKSLNKRMTELTNPEMSSEVIGNIHEKPKLLEHQ